MTTDTKQSRIIFGPYGRYEHGSAGAILNACCEIERVPLTRVEHFRIGSGRIQDGDNTVALFRWFDEIDEPLFRWDRQEYAQQRMLLNGNIFTPQYRLSLSGNLMPAFEVSGREATPELHEFLRGMLTNYTVDPRYKLSQAAGAFFQSGSNAPDGQWFVIEFWKAAGAEAWVEYINEHYRPEFKPQSHKDLT